MSAGGGRLEALITVPVGGWAVSANAGGGAFTATVPADDYYLSDLVAEFETQLNAGPGGTWGLSLSSSETGTGKVTISCSSTFSITWTSTDLRDVLGFTATITSAATPQTGANHAIGLWIPACPIWTPYGDANFDRISDQRQTIGPRGGVKTLQGNTFDALEGVRWEMVANARAVGLDVIGSWQHFWDTISNGRYSYVTTGQQVLWAWASGVLDLVYIIVPPSSAVAPVVSGWTGLYRVELPMVVKVETVS